MNLKHFAGMALGLALTSSTAQAAISFEPVTNYNWLQLSPGSVVGLVGNSTGFVGGPDTLGGNGRSNDNRWGHHVWAPSNSLTSNGTGMYFAAIQLDRLREVRAVDVEYWSSGTPVSTQFYVDGSVNGTSWVNFGTGAAATSSFDSRVTVNVPAPLIGEYKYVRVRFEPGEYTQYGGYGGPGLNTIDVRGNGTINSGEKVNYANSQFGTTTISNIPAFGGRDNRPNNPGAAARINGLLGNSDGDTGTSGNFIAGDYIELNFNTTRYIDEVILVAQNNYIAGTFDIEYSIDGTTFLPGYGYGAVTRYSNAGDPGATGRTFAGVYAQKIRIINATAPLGGYTLIDEILALSPIPEPASMGLVAMVGVFAFGRRRSRAASK